MTRTLLCFGDSNTHGTPPIPHEGAQVPRYDGQTRWPRVAARILGPDWELVEEGLPGRTAQFDDPIMGAHMNGYEGLKVALASHGPIDVLALMLGTNDVKGRFATTPQQVTAGIAGLLDIALSAEVQARHGGFGILVICPPPVQEVGWLAGQFRGGAVLSQGLPPLYASLAHERGCGFLNAGGLITVSRVDGVHFDGAAHAILGAAVAKEVAAL